MVGMDFFPRRLAPLQARLHPAWFYAGNNDECRLACGAKFNYSDEVVASWMDQTLEVKDVAAALLPEGVQALCEDPGRHAILDSLPKNDTWGLIPTRTPQGSGRASGHGGGTQAAPSRGIIIREGGSSLTARAMSPVTSEHRTPGTPEGALDSWGKSKRECLPSRAQVDSSSSLPSSSLSPRPGDAGQGCPAVAEAEATLGHPCFPQAAPDSASCAMYQNFGEGPTFPFCLLTSSRD
jgi:hypothetical protein